jgi:hypothetical protein
VIKSEPLDEVRDKHDSTLENLDPDDFDPDVLLRDSANLNDTFIAQATLECNFNNQTSSRDIEHIDISLLRPSAKRKNDDSNMPGTKPRTFRPYLSNSATPKKPKDVTAATSKSPSLSSSILKVNQSCLKSENVDKNSTSASKTSSKTSSDKKSHTTNCSRCGTMFTGRQASKSLKRHMKKICRGPNKLLH